MCNHQILKNQILKNQTIKNIVLVAFTLLLSACNGFFDKDNTPSPAKLVSFKPEIQPHLLWASRTASSVDDDYLKIGPAIGETAIFTASTKGAVTSTNKSNGYTNWYVNTGFPISTGPAIGDGLIILGSRKGDVIALQQSNGKSVWRRSIAGEILAKPAIGHGVVVIKTIDGYIRGLSTADGHELWAIQQIEPSLILRASSTPLIQGHDVIIGFANGNLVKLNLTDGQVFWLRAIAVAEGAFAIQRMIDIDADPVVYEHHIYAATYQGKIASLEWMSGRILWSHDISSYTGMTANDNTVYISDARSSIWAFNADTGLVNWRQTELDARIVTGPAVMGNYIVVGDGEGYLHWLSQRDGHFAARQSVGAAISAAPIVENNVVYAITKKGYLVAYTLSR
jgi:outer membrane protein assembly factor BamB